MGNSKSYSYSSSMVRMSTCGMSRGTHHYTYQLPTAISTLCSSYWSTARTSMHSVYVTTLPSTVHYGVDASSKPYSCCISTVQTFMRGTTAARLHYTVYSWRTDRIQDSSSHSWNTAQTWIY